MKLRLVAPLPASLLAIVLLGAGCVVLPGAALELSVRPTLPAGSCEAIAAATSRGDPADRPPLPGGLQRAVVERVIDGDTVVLHGGARVRYVGVNTPELASGSRPAQPGAVAATEANRLLVAGRQVELERDVSDTDRFGRLLRYVWVDGLLVNAEMVREGWANASSYPPDVRYQQCLRDGQREARAAGRGNWALPTPTPTARPAATPRAPAAPAAPR